MNKKIIIIFAIIVILMAGLFLYRFIINSDDDTCIENDESIFITPRDSQIIPDFTIEEKESGCGK